MGANQSTEVQCRCVFGSNVSHEIHVAVINGHRSAVEEFLKKGYINGAYKGWTMLHYACHHGRDKIVEMLLTHKDLCPNLRADGGKTALMMAAQNGHIDCVIVLTSATLNCKLDVDAKECRGRTALDLACEHLRPDIVCYLSDKTKDKPMSRDDLQKFVGGISQEEIEEMMTRTQLRAFERFAANMNSNRSRAANGSGSASIEYRRN